MNRSVLLTIALLVALLAWGAGCQKKAAPDAGAAVSPVAPTTATPETPATPEAGAPPTSATPATPPPAPAPGKPLAPAPAAVPPAKPVPTPATPSKPATPPQPAPAPPSTSNELRVEGVVKALAASPQPGSVAYKDCVIAVHLVQVKALSGKVAGSEALVFVWGMKDNKTMPAASYAAGQTITLRLTPWDQVEGKYGGYNRVELEGADLDALDLYWGDVS